jgi:hypothetical protein
MADSRLSRLSSRKKTLSAIDATAAMAPSPAARPARVERVVALDALRTDGDTQPRVGMDPELVAEYTARMSVGQANKVVDPTGAPFPPLVVYLDDEGVSWLADGFHRVEAARRAGIEAMQAIVRTGSRRDAFVASLGANATHGKRRTRADKRRAVRRALEDEGLLARSDSYLAEVCEVTDRFVSKMRVELEASGTIAYQPELMGKDGKWYEVSRPPAAASKPAPARRKPRAKASAAGKGSWRAIGQLARATPSDDALVVAHPLTAGEFGELARHAARAIEGGRLVVVLPDEGPLALEGPAALAPLLAAGFHGPRHVHVPEHDRVYMILQTTPCDLSGSCTLDELTGARSPEVYGAPISGWS